VKLLTELHGGAITMESVEGEGSCVTIWLPVRTAGDAARGTAAPTEVPPFEVLLTPAAIGERTALVVEDDPRSAELIRVQLEAQGFTVLHAENGEDGLVLAMERPLSLIILDIMLPQMDGWEF